MAEEAHATAKKRMAGDTAQSSGKRAREDEGDKPEEKKSKTSEKTKPDKEMGWQTFTPSVYPEFDTDQEMEIRPQARGSSEQAPMPVEEDRGTKRAHEDLPAQEGNHDSSDNMLLSIMDGRGKRTGQAGRTFIKEISERGDLLSITGGIQDTEYPENKTWKDIKAELEEHMDHVIGGITIHQAMAERAAGRRGRPWIPRCRRRQRRV